MTPMIQSLEGRRLLAAAVADGVLTVTGTAKNDSIVVSLSSDGETITVSERSSKRFKRGSVTTTEFAADTVTSIVVNAGNGNDTVTLRGNRTTDLTIPSTINGEAGNDKLYGGDGADSLSGGSGEDDLYGNAGTDTLSGGDDDDLLKGGADVDTLNGDAGDDLLLSAGDDAIDILDGGADSAATGADDEDQAITDDDETATGASVVDDVDVFPHYGGPHFGGFGFGMGGHGGHGHR